MTRQPPLRMRSTNQGLVLLVSLLFLSGCATSKDELMPTNGVTMQELWKQGSTGAMGSQGVVAARGELRRPIPNGRAVAEQTRYTRTAANEIYSQFSRLPNPDLVMYVYPHLAGSEAVPIPGYSTIFPLYSKPQYAMPGEGPRPEGRTR